MKSGFKALLLVVNVLYPFAIFAGLVFLDAPLRVFPFAFAGMVLIYFLSDFDSIRRKEYTAILRLVGLALAISLVILLMTITENAGYAKLYPVFINVSLLGAFVFSLIKPPTMIWRFATVANKKLEKHPDREKVERYCRNVTIIWCVFFIINASVALGTALWASDMVWSLYNGLISYILIGTLIAGEFIVRKIFKVGS